jgi:magnesium chelatase family protein
LVRVYGASLNGIEGIRVSIEVDAGSGLPAFHIVGHPDRVVNESRDRIRSAFRQSGLEFPPGRVTVNLAPTDIPKGGAALDLPLAVGIAATQVDLTAEGLDKTLYLGELGLDGGLRPVRGTLAMVAVADRAPITSAVVPLANLREASLCPGIRPFGARGSSLSTPWVAGASRRRPRSQIWLTSKARRPRDALSRSPPPAATTRS